MVKRPIEHMMNKFLSMVIDTLSGGAKQATLKDQPPTVVAAVDRDWLDGAEQPQSLGQMLLETRRDDQEFERLSFPGRVLGP